MNLRSPLMTVLMPVFLFAVLLPVEGIAANKKKGAGASVTEHVSRSSEPGSLAGDDYASRPVISGNGRFVAFASGADNLSDRDNNAVTNVFVRDLVTGLTELISVQSGASGAGADAYSSRPSISYDGRYVAFSSGADNLSDIDQPNTTDVFVRDRVAGTTMLVSRNLTVAGNAASSRPAISADGSKIAFSSLASNLSDRDNDAVTDVFVHDVASGATELVSRASDASGGAGGDLHSSRPSISATGRFVAFASGASNLSDVDSAGWDVFVRDTQTGVTMLASRKTGGRKKDGAGGDDHSSRPSISDSGRYVAFSSLADNLSNRDNDRFSNVFVRDLKTRRTLLVSRQNPGAGAAGGNGASSRPDISPDGRYVAFASSANNLSKVDDDRFTNVFLRDLRTGRLSLVSRASATAGNAAANFHASRPSVSAYGKVVAFASGADNLSTIDNDSVWNVFVRFSPELSGLKVRRK